MSVGNLAAVLRSGALVGTVLWEGARWPLSVTVPGALSAYDVLEFTVAGERQYFRASTVSSSGNPHHINQNTTSYNIIFKDGDGEFTVSCGNSFGAPTVTRMVGYRHL